MIDCENVAVFSCIILKVNLTGGDFDAKATAEKGLKFARSASAPHGLTKSLPGW